MWNIIPERWFCRDLGLILKCEKFKRNEKNVFKDAGSLETVFVDEMFSQLQK